MLFLVKGIGYGGESFNSRFESASEEVLRNWMIDNGVTVERIRAMPLTTGPYGKSPWLIIAFPVLVGLLVMTTYALVAALGVGAGSNWMKIVLLVLVDGILALVTYNILLRLGSFYDFGGEGVVQYSRGSCVSTHHASEDDDR